MRNQSPYLYLIFVFLFILVVPQASNAHKLDQNYIYLRVYENSMEVRVEMETDDINKALGLQLPKGLTEEEFAPYLSQFQDYIFERISFSSNNNPYEMVFKKVETLILEMGTFIMVSYDLKGPEQVPDDLTISNSVLFDKEPNHQGMAIVEYNWKAGVFKNESLPSLIFTPSSIEQTLDLTDSSIMKGFLNMIWMGVWHIFIGIDHILFLLALVLPAVVYRFSKSEKSTPYYNTVSLPGIGTFNNWGPVEKFRPALMYVLVIVTFFTISHCITLSLAALEIVNLPSRFVESIIAISIALAALNNIRHLVRKDWMIAFGFGLFHGFGFASVLGDIGLTGEYMVLSLLGFNLGVEIGQIAIICAVFPILYFLRKSKNYSKILVYGSVILIAISLYWFIERAFEIDLPVDDFINKVIRKIKYIAGI
jgi:HupE/UreJ protein/uncharacterized protein DUF6702